MGGWLISEQRAADARTAVLGIALLADAAALVVLRGVVDGSVMRAYAAAHLALLSIDLVLTRAALTRASLQETARTAAVVIEIGVVLAWLHAAGSTSTALLALTPVLVAAYRVAHGDRIAARGATAIVAGKIALLVAESAGAIAIAPLFGDMPAPPLVWRIGGALIGICADVGAYVVATSFATATIVARARPANDRPKTRESTAQRNTPASFIEPAPLPPGPIAQLEVAGLVGRVIAERYEIRTLLARGGMGDVYRAAPIDGGTDVAIKILHAHVAAAPDMIARFHDEVRAVQKLPHDRIAPAHEVGEDAGLHYLVMDLLEGEDLATVLRREHVLPREDVTTLADHLAQAFEAAHGAGIVHRDVKPANVFVTRDAAGRPSFRLLDFGIARLLDDAGGNRVARTTGLLGSPGYLAPEQVCDRFGDVGPRTDVFAIGAVLYRALTGVPAFPSRQAAAAMNEATNLHPPAPSARRRELPADVDLVIATALAKAPADRHGSVSELARDLRLAFDAALPEDRRARARSLIGRAQSTSTTITSAA